MFCEIFRAAIRSGCVAPKLKLSCILLVVGGCVHSVSNSSGVAGSDITVTSKDLSPDQEKDLLATMTSARAKIEAFWGQTFDGAIAIKVDSRYRIPRALVPAWNGNRGVIEFPTDRVMRGVAPTVHELVHVYAPNQNRLLAEGLAVYLHERLLGNAAFPNFGKPLKVAVKGKASKIRIAALDGVSTPEPLHTSGVCDEQTCYLVAGSFVNFLVERYGMERFQQLYGMTPLKPGERGNGGLPARFDSLYQRSLEKLEEEWRNWLFDRT